MVRMNIDPMDNRSRLSRGTVTKVATSTGVTKITQEVKFTKARGTRTFPFPETRSTQKFHQPNTFLPIS